MPAKLENIRQRLRSAVRRAKTRPFSSKGKNSKSSDDRTVASAGSLPRTLKEALPDDLAAREKDPRSIIVTEITKPFNVVGVNTAWENLCGYKECEAVGKSPAIIQGEETDHQGLRDAVARLFKGEDVECETVNYRKDGTRFRNYLRMGPIYNEVTGEMTHFVGILKNIGEVIPRSNHKSNQDSQAAIDEKSLPRTLKEALPDDLTARASDPRAIIVTEINKPFNVVGVNMAWENLCGYKECEAVGKSPAIIQGEETDFQGLRDAVARLFQGEDVECETVNYRKDGTRFRNHLRMGPIYDEMTGDMTHFVGILKNIREIIPLPAKAQ